MPMMVMMVLTPRLSHLWPHGVFLSLIAILFLFLKGSFARLSNQNASIQNLDLWTAKWLNIFKRDQVLGFIVSIARNPTNADDDDDNGNDDDNDDDEKK